MNVSIVTSFKIGGLFLLSIIAMKRNMMLHSVETTYELMNVYEHELMFDMITHDLSRIGYGFPTGSNTVEIKQLDDDGITFTADVLENGVKEIKWEFTGSAASTTENPNDKILRRHGTMGSGTPSDLESDYYITDFKITGYKNSFGEEETTNPAEVKSLLVESLTNQNYLRLEIIKRCGSTNKSTGKDLITKDIPRTKCSVAAEM